MSERIFVGVAWPYANGPLHLGHIAGAYLPADIFSRYHRLKGNQIIMVSGSDQHGTPITLQAEKEKRSPKELADTNHQGFMESWMKLGIQWDLFTTTETPNHYQVSQEIFLRLYERGYIYKGTTQQAYCPKDQRFLADRYVEGNCPHCGFTFARGDQCDKCGKPLNANELVQPHCSICGTKPEFRDTEHFFLKLSAFQGKLLEWVRQQTHWREHVRNFTMAYLESGLNDRAITRDIEWGIPVPLAGYESKRIYVWFEAVIGYLSAAKEWAQLHGTPDKWRDFWQGNVKPYYFIGKDNIPFHTIIWPAMLMGYDDLSLPYDVPANEFLTIEGKKLSTSRHWAVWVPEYLEKFDPEPLRYLLSINMPENGDADFSWREFVRHNNDELVATYGNLVNRVLTFVYKNYDGSVPAPSTIDASGQALLDKATVTFNTVDSLIHDCRFKEGIKQIMMLAQDANRYLDEKSPWKAIKTDKVGAGTSLYVTICVLACLKTMLYPYLPFSSQRVHEYLGFPGKVSDAGWQIQFPPAGQQLMPPKPLFIKLDDAIIEEETRRLKGPAA